MTDHTHSSAPQGFCSEIDQIDLAAALVAMDFEMADAPEVVKRQDLGSSTSHDAKSMTWRFYNMSMTHGDMLAVMQDWAKPVMAGRVVSPAQLCRLCLHNRRVLKTLISHGAPLYQQKIDLVSRLSNWPTESAAKIEQRDAPAPGLANTMQAAVCATLGCPLLGWQRVNDQYSFFFAEGQYVAPSQIQARWHDNKWIVENKEPLALLIATCRNFEALAQKNMRRTSLVLYKNGKYALIDKNANAEAQRRAAIHLNV